MNNDLIGYLKDLIERVKDGSLTGVVVYGVTPAQGAHYGVVGQVGIDDFSILSVRAGMSAAECLRAMEHNESEAHSKPLM